MDKIASMAGRYWVTIFLWTLVFLLATGKEARAQRQVANERHLAAAMIGEECSVFRGLVKRTAAEIDETKARLAAQLKSSQDKRSELEACAKSRGIESIANEDQEALAAEVCPEAYGAWLYPGYGVRIAEEDLEEATHGLQRLQGHLKWNCLPLPKAQTVSASVTSFPSK